MLPAICEAIRMRLLIEFDYRGRPRVVQPYCHSTSARGGEVVRAIQVGGSSRSEGFGFGKLWIVAEMRNVRVSEVTFTPDDPHYNPNDSAMRSIHCHV
jgi:hypothetical protein